MQKAPTTFRQPGTVWSRERRSSWEGAGPSQHCRRASSRPGSRAFVSRTGRKSRRFHGVPDSADRLDLRPEGNQADDIDDGDATERKARLPIDPEKTGRPCPATAENRPQPVLEAGILPASEACDSFSTLMRLALDDFRRAV